MVEEHRDERKFLTGSSDESEPIEIGFEKAFKQAGYTSPVFSYDAKIQMQELIIEGLKHDKAIAERLGTNQLASRKGGFIVEEVHAESFNHDAILKGKNYRAVTDQSSDWGGSGNDMVADIKIMDGDKVVHTAQSKYYENAQKTAESFAKSRDGRPQYENADTHLAPSDQAEGVRLHAAESAQTSQDPVKIEASKQTVQKTSDHIEHDGVKSKPLSKKDADDIGSGDLSKRTKMQNEYRTTSTLKQMGKAGASAFALSAVVSGSVNTVRYISLARDGKLSYEDAVVNILVETTSSAADSAIKASSVVGVQSLMVRYGAETVLINNIAKQGLKSLVRTNTVTVGVISLIDAVKDLVSLGMGKMTEKEFYERQGKGIMNTSAGVMGGTLGAVALGSFPLIGGISGGLIAGLAVNFAIENGIERPYRDLLQNTESLASAAHELEHISANVFGGQILFSKIIEHDNMLEGNFCAELGEIDEAGERAFSAINKI